MKQYACINENNIVVAIQFLNIANGEGWEDCQLYVQVGDGGINPIPSIGQTWDGLNMRFV